MTYAYVAKRLSSRPVVWTYELDPVNKSYTSTGVHHDRLKLSSPYDIDVDLTAIDAPQRPADGLGGRR